MKLVQHFAISLCAFQTAMAQASAASSALLRGPQTVDELVAKVFPEGDAPQFTPLPSTPQIAVAGNDTALLKLLDLKVSHLPMKPGYITFDLDYFLTSLVPLGATIEIKSFVGNETGYDGSTELCPYLAFANLHCPLKATKKSKSLSKTLQVPDTADAGHFSFIAKALTPKGDLIAHVAGLVDIVQDGTRAGHSPDGVSHEEL